MALLVDATSRKRARRLAAKHAMMDPTKVKVSLANCMLVSQQTIQHACQMEYSPSWKQEFKSIPANATVHVSSRFLQEFANSLSLLHTPINLVTVDHIDVSKTCMNLIVENDLILQWFVGDFCMNHPKCRLLPTGIRCLQKSLHFKITSPLERERYLLAVKSKSGHIQERIARIACQASFQQDRIPTFAFLSNDSSHLMAWYAPTSDPTNDPRKEWNHISLYQAFALVVRSRLDLHRLWEALCLGCLVLVDKQSISPKLVDMISTFGCDSALVLVDDWSQINGSWIARHVSNYKWKPDMFLARTWNRILYA